MTIAIAILAMALIFAGLFWTLFVDMPAAARRRKDPSA